MSCIFTDRWNSCGREDEESNDRFLAAAMTLTLQNYANGESVSNLLYARTIFLSLSRSPRLTLPPYGCLTSPEVEIFD